MANEIKPELKPFIPLAKGIAKTFGESCEVVIHDLSHPKTSVIFVVNGHVTGRKVGEGIRDLLLDVLSSPDFNEDGLFNYESTPLKGKRTIKSSTMVIRDSAEKMIGAFCINIDVSAIKNAEAFFRDFAQISRPSSRKKGSSEINGNDVIQIIDQLIEQTVKESEIPVSHMKKEDFLKLISFMEDKGVFLMKGSVEKVAEKLSLSKYTVYGYLKEINKGQKINRKL